LANFIKRITRAVTASGVMLLAGMSFADSRSDKVDELANSLDDMESKVQSTLLSGGASPISFSGEARLKVQYHDLGFDAPGYMQADRTYLQSGWEGNDNLFRLGMVARAGRNTVLWAKIGFQHTLIGNRDYSDRITKDNYMPYQYRNDKAGNSITIHEDMNAGIAVRTVPASFWMKLGNTIWTEASPLTVWKAQPRTFAWEYLPFEVEQPIARYYEYNIAKGEKAGRAAWNKKPFNGINVESINLPADIYANFVYGTFERFDNFEREYIDFAGDLGYADGAEGPFPAKGHGVGDSYRHVTHGRLAKGKLFGDMTWGLNYVGIDYTDDVLYAASDNTFNTDTKYQLLYEFRGNDSIFVKEPKIFSTDIRGSIGSKFTVHADVAFSVVDTVWYYDTVSARKSSAGNTERMGTQMVKGKPEYYNNKGISSSDFVPAFYAKLGYNGFLPVEADIAYIGKGFYSPFSFAVPQDGFFAYGTNMVGAGKFIARGEGSPYAQNMAGVNLTFSPKLSGYGHLRLKYGQHFNIEEGRDVLFFPYRLNGSDMFSFFHSSYNRWGNGLIDNSVKAGGRTYKGRLGDQSFMHGASYNTNADIRTVGGPNAGGLRSDFLAMYEGFVQYKTKEDAYNNWYLNSFAGNGEKGYGLVTSNNAPGFVGTSTIVRENFDNYYIFRDTSINGRDTLVKDTLARSTATSWVPESKKYTFNLELDAAYDIAPVIGYKKDLFVGGYVGVNGISSSIKPLAFSDETEDMLMWSLYVRLEPAIALHKNFYLLGLFGYENWRARNAWMMRDVPTGRILNPIARSYQNGDGKTAWFDPASKTEKVRQEGTDAFGMDRNKVTTENFVEVPIDYRDFAYGLGFDWDVLERVGLHGRAKYISHEDRGLNEYYDGVTKEKGTKFSAQDKNDWGTWVFSLEVKTWF
jgi:hypothetical protein